MSSSILTIDQSNLHDEYNAIRNTVALIDFSSAGKLQISGKNSVQFLNGLISNDVKTLAAGDGMLAAFPTLQGKLSALCRVYNTATFLLLELDTINKEKIFKNLSKYVPAGEFFVTNISDQYGLISLQGPKARDLIKDVSGQAILSDAEYKIYERIIAQSNTYITTHDRTGSGGFDIFIPATDMKRVGDSLLSHGKKFGAMWGGELAFELARIESGIPKEGIDAGENYIILESELDRAVSYTKGCYLGQEIIARIHWRGQPAKRLRGLFIESNDLPKPGTLLYTTDGKKTGEVTSAIHSFALNRNIALAYVHRNYLDPGTEFILKDADAQELGSAQLATLPFI